MSRSRESIQSTVFRKAPATRPNRGELLRATSRPTGVVVDVTAMTTDVLDVAVARKHPVDRFEEGADQQRQQGCACQRDKGSWDRNGDHGFLPFSVALS